MEEAYFVDVLASDPEQIPPMVLLNGFEGKSALPDYCRLYLNAVLSEFYEIPQEAVLHRQQVCPAGALLASTVLWVRADAGLIRRDAHAQQHVIRFLSASNQAAISPGEAENGPDSCRAPTPACVVDVPAKLDPDPNPLP